MATHAFKRLTSRAIVLAWLASLLPAGALAEGKDFHVRLKFVSPTPDKAKLMVYAENPTDLDVCIHDGWPRHDRLQATINGKELDRSSHLISGRPPVDYCGEIKAHGTFKYEIDLNEIYPNQNISGAYICLFLSWNYKSQAEELHVKHNSGDICITAP